MNQWITDWPKQALMSPIEPKQAQMSSNEPKCAQTSPNKPDFSGWGENEVKYCKIKYLIKGLMKLRLSKWANEAKQIWVP